MTDVLTAIDEALDTGVAADDDPLTRELQELALALEADAPEPTPVYREWLDKRVEEGFAKRVKQGPAWWQRLMHPAAATGLIAAAVIAVVVVAGGSGTSQDVAGGDGGGGAALEAGGDGEASSGGDRAQGAAPADGGSAAPGTEPFVDDGALSRRSAGAAPPIIEPPPGGPGFAPGQRNRKIERAVGLELEMPVDEMARVAEQVTVVTNRHGGFVLSSSVSTGDSAGGDFELRIPANRLRPALRDLSALADVRTQSQTGRDVTREHVTARDRLQSARAERRSLLRRLEVAATDEEAEAIRRRLDLVAGEINGLRGQLRDLRLRTDYAVVTVSLLASDGESDEGGASGSFDDALGDAGELLVGVAGVLVRALAVALPIGLIALAGWAAGRVLRRRRRESALI
jgi:hypothetical protein